MLPLVNFEYLDSHGTWLLDLIGGAGSATKLRVRQLLSDGWICLLEYFGEFRRSGLPLAVAFSMRFATSVCVLVRELRTSPGSASLGRLLQGRLKTETGCCWDRRERNDA